MQQDQNDLFRKLLSKMLVAARRNKKTLASTVISARWVRSGRSASRNTRPRRSHPVQISATLD